MKNQFLTYFLGKSLARPKVLFGIEIASAKGYMGEIEWVRSYTTCEKGYMFLYV